MYTNEAPVSVTTSATKLKRSLLEGPFFDLSLLSLGSMTSAASNLVKISLELAKIFKAQRLIAVTLPNTAPLMNTLKLNRHWFEFDSVLDLDPYTYWE